MGGDGLELYDAELRCILARRVLQININHMALLNLIRYSTSPATPQALLCNLLCYWVHLLRRQKEHFRCGGRKKVGVLSGAFVEGVAAGRLLMQNRLLSHHIGPVFNQR